MQHIWLCKPQHPSHRNHNIILLLSCYRFFKDRSTTGMVTGLLALWAMKYRHRQLTHLFTLTHNSNLLDSKYIYVKGWWLLKRPLRLNHWRDSEQSRQYWVVWWESLFWSQNEWLSYNWCNPTANLQTEPIVPNWANRVWLI